MSDDKRLTKSAAEIIAAAQQEIAQDQALEAKLERLGMLSAEWFGFDGRGGKLELMERELQAHRREIADLRLFKHKLMTIYSVLSILAGGAAVVVSKLLEYLF